MTGYRFTFALLPFILCTLTGCGTMMEAHLPLLGPLPEGFSVREFARADAGAPFAVDRAGTMAAISKGTLRLIDPRGGEREILEGTPSALCFSPSGDRLAAALPVEGKTLLRLFDREGKIIGETTLPERVTALAWRSETLLLATALTVRRYTFGSNLTTRLYTWDGVSAPVSTQLSDETIRPGLAKLPEAELAGNFTLAVSPYGDEIAYSAIKDPPLFATYLRVTIRNIESGAEKVIGEPPVGSGGALYTPDGESLLVGYSHTTTRRLSIPDGKETYAWPASGSYPAISRSGAYLFLEGRLYLDGTPVASFPNESRGNFLPDGSGLAVSYNGRLFLVSGLNDRPAPALPADLERLLKLRRLRGLGLITEKEYRAQKGKVSAP